MKSFCPKNRKWRVCFNRTPNGPEFWVGANWIYLLIATVVVLVVAVS